MQEIIKISKGYYKSLNINRQKYPDYFLGPFMAPEIVKMVPNPLLWKGQPIIFSSSDSIK